jgi:hypothetical protein
MPYNDTYNSALAIDQPIFQSWKRATSGTVVRLSLSLGVLCSVNLVRPAFAQSLNCTQPVRFGRLVRCASAGTISVTPNGVVNTDGCVFPLGTPLPAKCNFNVTQPQTRSIQVSVTAGAYNMTGAGTMAIDSFNVATSAAGRVKLYAPSSIAGTKTTIGIGAKLNVSGSQTAGSYNGSVNVSISFP